jgi:hypothetical protein
MKPEHLDWVNRIWEIILRAVGESNRATASPA